jgi:hypothetical protein
MQSANLRFLVIFLIGIYIYTLYDFSNNFSNTTISTHPGLSEVMEALEIGDAHLQSETEEHGHDHRRKRSADMSSMLHKESWVNSYLNCCKKQAFLTTELD